MSSSTSRIGRYVIPALAPLVVLGGAACGGEKLGEHKQPLTLADGAIIDAPAEEIGDGWISGDGGVVDSAATDVGPLCPGQDAGTLNSYVGANGYIQIDVDESARDAGTVGANANLVVDPSDAGFDEPAAITSASPTFTDWSSLASSGLSDHRVLDIFAAKDPSAFPGSSSCVGAANNPAKDELLYAGIANNNDYVYLNVLRASSLGDMGYTWLFTRDKPTCASAGNCSTFLRYHVQAGDVLIFGHFRTGSAKLLSVFKAKTGVDVTLDADATIEWCNTAVWEEDTSGVGAVAVNTSIAATAGWGSDGLKNPQSLSGQPAYEPHIFAEGAVKTSTFGTAGVCGQTFWASVISKSSGNACEGADMKDLVGPRHVNFGSITPVPHVKPNCNGTVDLQVTVTGATGTLSCKWYDGATKIFESPTCDAIVGVPLSAGVHNLTVEVSDAGSTCTATSAAVSVGVYPEPTATCTLTPACTATDNLGYGVTGTGQGTLTYEWTLTNSAATVGLPQPTGTSGTLTVSPVGPSITYYASAEVKDSRGCKATCPQKSAVPLAPITVTLGNPLSIDRMCVAPYASFADDVTYAATGVTGGDGSYTYAWAVQACTDPSDAGSCTTSSCTSNPTTSQCTIDPAGTDTCLYRKIAVSVDDGSVMCAAQNAGPRIFKKTTVVHTE
ncbi:MAG: hypothetical protein HYV09_25580 [Deltaproteobacteria bacterium]|nr:hypothetical protein [Deltaproteobacteria bacterium]